jgi:hypothetical protein
MAKPLDEDLRVRVVGAVREDVASRVGGSFWGQRLERDPVGQAGRGDRLGAAPADGRRSSLEATVLIGSALVHANAYFRFAFRTTLNE